MSEYQYYEFVAVDRPLTRGEIAELRELSTRADISSTRFVNHYNFGDFGGSPDRLMERYFDAHLYLANWGTHILMFRVPAEALDIDVARQYCGAGYQTEVRVHGDHVILSLRSEDESGDSYDGPGALSSFVSARAELISGDRRLLYLAWLFDVESLWDEELDMDEVEPPVPPGLDSLSASLEAIVEFLRMDQVLLDVAARGDETSRRTVGQLLAAAAEVRSADERAEAEQARQEHVARMESLAGRENALWERVSVLIAAKAQREYDEAVDVLADLHELARWRGDVEGFAQRVGGLRAVHRRLPSLIRRFDAAGLP
ncbi:hypothetical protein GCM10022267_74460 [Lentzea roselyniae]|uniref:Uncharacterized protein n=1 Tax=Lentzea roselyniae TaxID=531940 RepID=A0ABP7C4U2_9PSEU